MSLSAGSSPLHSPKITPHTSPAPRRRSHTPNPANYMVPTTASDQGTHIIQKETVGGTTYFYTDNTPAPLAGMVCAALLRVGNTLEYSLEVQSKCIKMQHTYSNPCKNLSWTRKLYVDLRIFQGTIHAQCQLPWFTVCSILWQLMISILSLKNSHFQPGFIVCLRMTLLT